MHFSTLSPYNYILFLNRKLHNYEHSKSLVSYVFVKTGNFSFPNPKYYNMINSEGFRFFYPGCQTAKQLSL